ncbi:hypothetical protein [Variovorax fucosicus]|uniref:hypothetical protein n=1 Tax=Variovorax fucosicus TaxID=3053517 RepID=UPI0025786617|nr:hypothetical protein [Variovorax sp. J22G47]MDM0059425.1 hypothetical protein [Variovorax sp. J22G47]
MPSLREEYREVTDALEKAYLADKAAYEILPRRSKDFWALQPPQSWPTAPEFKDWFMARLALLEAEQRVIKMLRARCELIRHHLGRATSALHQRTANYPAYMEQIVDTVPDDLHLADYLRMPQVGGELPAVAAATATTTARPVAQAH